jgi:hypothetical protein
MEGIIVAEVLMSSLGGAEGRIVTNQVSREAEERTNRHRRATRYMG